jgi:hypothetical protein
MNKKSNMNNNLYSIQIGENTYIDWCDKNWYGTITFPVAKFTREEAQKIVQQLIKHFRYYVTITNNTETIKYEFGKEITYLPQQKTKPNVIHTHEEPECDTHDALSFMEW